jgi:hypothetical protein
MALITYGPLAAAARGSLGPLVFTLQNGRPAVRIALPQLQPNSSAQKGKRAALKANAQTWAYTLTPAQRAAWTALGVAYPKTDVFGQKYNQTGIAIFIALNTGLALIGLPAIANAPAILSVGNPSTLTASYTPAPQQLILAPGNPPGPTDVPCFFASACRSSGAKPQPDQLACIGYGTPGQAGPYDVTDLYLAKFLQFIPALQAGVGIKFTNNATGYQSAEAYSAVIITT